MDELVRRINELTAISKTRELTTEEEIERKQLRNDYIEKFRGNLVGQLKNIKVVNEAGEDITPEKVKELKKNKGDNDYER